MPGKNIVNAIDLPIIDFSKVGDKHDLEKRRDETSKLIDAFSNVGFAIVENIDGYNEEELFQCIQWFYYEVDSQERLEQLAIKEFNPKNKNVYRGIFPLIEGKLSHKEGYDMGNDFPGESEEEKFEREKNPLLCDTPRLTFPDERQAQAENFYEVVYRHFRILQKVADNLMAMIAEAGGEKSDFFAGMFDNLPHHTLRTIMYPVRKSNIPDGAYLPDGRIVSTPAHQDSGFLTLLQTFGFPGLEILLNKEWFSVQVSKFPKTGGTLIVNVGEQLSAMSNNRFKATIHRVLDIGKDRFSMPFFYEPSLDACINKKIPKALLLTEDTSSDEHIPTCIPYGSFLLNKLPIYTEWSRLLEMLPQEILDKYLGQRKVKVSNWASKTGIEVDGMSYDDKIAASSENLSKV